MPKHRVIWLFGVVAYFAISAFGFRLALIGKPLGFFIVIPAVFLLVYAALSMVLFVIAYASGRLGQLVEEIALPGSSPFADAGLPGQLLPPKITEE